MNAIRERVPAPSSGNFARCATSTAAAALTALALGAPQWAAAQAQEQEEVIEEEVITTEEEPMMTPEEKVIVVPAQPEPIAPPRQEMMITEQPAAMPEAETGAFEPVPAPVPGEGKGKGPEVGAAVAAGGGVSDFSRSEAREFVKTGGAWELRGVFGTRSWLGLEAAYIGAAYGLEGPGDASTLVSNGAELSARLNLLRNGMRARATGVQPYVLAGGAWKNYQLSGDLATADVADEDNTFEVPVGAGIAYYFANRMMLDGRFAYRFAFAEDLIEPIDADETALDNWSATARLGVEF